MRTMLFAFIAAAAAAGAAFPGEGRLLPYCLDDAKVGEWVVMKNISEPGETVRSAVVARGTGDDGETVTISREVTDADGGVADRKERTIRLSRYRERIAGLEEKAVRVTRERMDFKDRPITVFIVEVVDEETGREVKIWLSNDIPVSGVVRMWSSDPEFPTYELEDFGTD